MVDNNFGFADLKTIVSQKIEVEVSVAAGILEKKSVERKEYVQKIDNLGRAYSTGKRKNAIARVWIKPGKGIIMVNGKKYEDYFARKVLQMLLREPFGVTKRSEQYDVFSTVKGGGLSGQAGALKHGISKALCLYEPELRESLKSAGFLTRDSRIVERKKPGQPKARKKFQFSKR